MTIEARYLNWEYVPENSYDKEDGGVVYTWNDFLNIAKGNEKLAMLLIDTCDWQYPETEIDQLLMMDEIAEHNDGYVMLYDDAVLRQIWAELGDVPFYENKETFEMMLEDNWLVFDANTSRNEIWEWFDEHYSGGVYKLMFPNNQPIKIKVS